tara:strand:+ start:176 stop:559 length:384 start_codon:yes stop_codon:yes gene_type:complete
MNYLKNFFNLKKPISKKSFIIMSIITFIMAVYTFHTALIFVLLFEGDLDIRYVVGFIISLILLMFITIKRFITIGLKGSLVAIAAAIIAAIIRYEALIESIMGGFSILLMLLSYFDENTFNKQEIKN